MCALVSATVRLPAELRETSGVAVGRAAPDVLWTHNDEGATLYALDRAGSILARFDVQARLRDPEDIAAAECDGRACLYLADTGDNAERRPAGDPRIVRVLEPTSLDGGPLDADVFPVRFPDGPRDVEALFVLPGERPFLVTKGRSGPVTLYRYPPPLRPETVELVEVQRLSGAAPGILDLVTAADASADGRVVAIRTYRSMRLYRAEGDRIVPAENGLVDLSPLEETQGEAVGIGPDGRVVLTSEGGLLGGPPSMRALTCRLDEI